MKASTVFVIGLILGGTFLVVWRLKANGSAADREPAQLQTAPSSAPSPAADAPRRDPAAETEARKLLNEGLQAQKKGDEQAAIKAFSDVLKRFPSQPAAAQAGINLAAIHRKAGNLFEARNVLSQALKAAPEGQTRDLIVQDLQRLNGELVFSKKEAPDSITYVVKSGDNLSSIAKKYHITANFIKRVNYLTSDLIQVDRRLKLFQGPFDVVIEKSRFRLTVYRGGIFIRQYRIGLGKNGSTPEGEFAVSIKLVDPPWDPPGPEHAAAGAPDNPLGTRWIEFAPHYGIHGTLEPESIGTEESRGCVRLLNDDVEELYDLVVPGSKVRIIP